MGLSTASVGFISSVPRGGFQNMPMDPYIFAPHEIISAKKPEERVRLDTLDRAYEAALLLNWVKFELINALEGLPKQKKHDLYIMGGSPNMVTDPLLWIDELKGFARKQADNGTPILGVCFWHQILASAFGSEVDYMAGGGQFWPVSVLLNAKGQGDSLFGQMESHFDSLQSHKQAVLTVGSDIEVLWSTPHDPNAIIKVSEHARGMQFHPEFTVDFMQFLRKLMDGSLVREGFNPADIERKLLSMIKNDGSKLIQLFLKKYIG